LLGSRILRSVSEAGDGAVTGQERGAELERIVADYLERQGYVVTLNATLTGRSGATHEIDVLAEKADAVTTFRMAVECKARNQPIEKDVVYKLAGVMADVGIAKGVIASLAGARVGAEIVAKQHAIDLWGPKELAPMIPEGPTVPVAEEAPPGPELILSCAVSQEAAHAVILRAITPYEQRAFRKARPLPPREQLLWLGFAWFPMWCFRFTEVRGSGRSTVFFTYDGVSGRFLQRDPGPPRLIQATLPPGSPIIPADLPATAISDDIMDAFRRWWKVSSKDAVEKHGDRLYYLGFSPIPSKIEVEGVKSFLCPVWIGLVHDGASERAAVVHGVSGHPDPKLSGVATRHLTYIRNSLARS
jgi:hypothetical protein